MSYRFTFGRNMVVAAAFVTAALIASPHSNAADYMIDEDNSSISISGSVDIGADDPLSIDEQFAGSLSAKYSGNIVVDVSGGTITFNSATMQALHLDTDPQPGVGGVGGTAPGNYGGSVAGGLGLFAGRNFAMTLDSGPLALAGGNFDLAGISLVFTDGEIDYSVPFLGEQGTTPLVPAFPDPPLVVNLAGTGLYDGNMLTLNIVNASLDVEIPGTGTANLKFNGNITAVPEPSAIGLGLASSIALIGLRRWRSRA